MKNFAKKLQNDAEERKKFVDFMHTREDAIKNGTSAIAEKLNPFYVKLILDFAKQEGYEITDDPAVQEKSKEICAQVAENIQNNVIAQFHNALK